MRSANNLGNALRAQNSSMKPSGVERAIEIRENLSRSLHNSDCLRDMQKLEQADASYRPRYRVSAKLSRPLYNLANVLIAPEEYDDGVRILGDYAKLYPNNLQTL